MIKWAIIICLAASLAVVSICRPDFLATNSFLIAFSSDSAVALLAVILTVTLASVANIHLTINRIISKVYRNAPDKGKLAAEPARKEINENAWILLIVFMMSIISIFIGGISGVNLYIKSLVHGSVILYVIVNAIVLYDIYKVTFDLSRAELDIELDSK